MWGFHFFIYVKFYWLGIFCCCFTCFKYSVFAAALSSATSLLIFSIFAQSGSLLASSFSISSLFSSIAICFSGLISGFLRFFMCLPLFSAKPGLIFSSLGFGLEKFPIAKPPANTRDKAAIPIRRFFFFFVNQLLC